MLLHWEFGPYSGCSGLEEGDSVKGAAADLLWAENWRTAAEPRRDQPQPWEIYQMRDGRVKQLFKLRLPICTDAS